MCGTKLVRIKISGSAFIMSLQLNLTEVKKADQASLLQCK